MSSISVVGLFVSYGHELRKLLPLLFIDNELFTDAAAMSILGVTRKRSLLISSFSRSTLFLPF